MCRNRWCLSSLDMPEVEAIGASPPGTQHCTKSKTHRGWLGSSFPVNIHLVYRSAGPFHHPHTSPSCRFMAVRLPRTVSTVLHTSGELLRADDNSPFIKTHKTHPRACWEVARTRSIAHVSVAHCSVAAIVNRNPTTNISTSAKPFTDTEQNYHCMSSLLLLKFL